MTPAGVAVAASAGAALTLAVVAVWTVRHDEHTWDRAYREGAAVGRRDGAADLRRRLDIWQRAEPDMPLADALLQLDLARAVPAPDLDAIFPLDPDEEHP